MPVPGATVGASSTDLFRTPSGLPEEDDDDDDIFAAVSRRTHSAPVVAQKPTRPQGPGQKPAEEGGVPIPGATMTESSSDLFPTGREVWRDINSCGFKIII